MALTRPGDRWRQISQLYHEALELQPNQRAALLEQSCAGDEALRLEVESLLAQPASAEALLAERGRDVEARWPSNRRI